MNPKNTNTDGLFDSVRKAPTELSHANVESMIKNFPTVPPNSIQPSNNWTHLFNLNNLIMMSIPIAIVVALSLTTIEDTDKLHATNLSNLSTEITTAEFPTIEYTKAKAIQEVKEESDLSVEVNNENTNSNKSINPALIKNSTEEPVVAENKIPTTDIVKPPTEQNLNPKPITVTASTKIPKQVLNEQKLEVPELTPVQMKKLKRTLYKNLLEDDLIRYKDQFVKIELPGKQILVNDQEVPNNLNAKYTNLTMIAGTGPFRKIEMDSKHIKVGDFTEDGFKGSGVGTFISKIDNDLSIPSPLKPDDKEKSILDERKAAFTFATKTLRKSEIRAKGKSLFPIRVKSDKLILLHEELYTQLLKDNLINAKTDFVFIQLPKYDIAINGKKLQIPLPTKYLNIVEAYKIKHGGRRAIILSQHTVSVGDYVDGEFTGTSLNIVE